MKPDKIILVLNTHIEKGFWQLTDSPTGKSKTSYIGIHKKKKVFIKLDSANEPLGRLSAIDITPKVLYSDQNISIQECIKGDHPTIDFISDNYKQFANLIKKYHSDQELTMVKREYTA